MMRQHFHIIVLVLAAMVSWAFAGRVTAQDRPVSGIVSDTAGTPLPGVGVQIAGSTDGTTTDLDGRYSIGVPEGATLIFSCIGMVTQEVRVGKSSVINVTLNDDVSLLEEAVSIGYSTQFRSLVTNSIQKVGADEFRQSPQQNALTQLQGKVPGLVLQVNSGQPGAAPQIFLRGGTTSSPESDTPLIIIDGVISSGTRGIQDMNPADIESMEVLKDAASTAIYGARAANGIIIVKTKAGSEGKPNINFRYTFSLDQQPSRIDLLNAEDYVYLTRSNTAKFNTSNPDTFLSGGTWGMSTGHDYYSANTLDFLDNYINSYGQDFVADLINNHGWKSMRDPVTGRMLLFQDNDMQDATFQKAHKREYDFNISGGSNGATYYTGFRYMDQEGILRGTKYENFSAIFNSNRRLSSKWSMETKATVNWSKSNSASSTINSITRAVLMPPTYRLYYPDGSPAPGEGMDSFRNRLYEIEYEDKYTAVINTLATFQSGAQWDILPGLTFRPTAYYTFTDASTNKFEALNETTGTEIRPSSAVRNHTDHIQADAVLNYNGDFGKHNVGGTLGASYNFDRADNLSGSGSGAPSDLIPTLNATADSTQRVTNTIAREAMLSAFGRVSYAYDGKYLASASLRADGSSKFSEKHRWGFFPGASLGWNIHKEEFFKGLLPLVNKLKLRASWGVAGNNSLSLANTYGLYSITSDYMGQVGVLNTTLKNDDLVWESTESYDAGLDVSLFGDRIGIVLDVYRKYTYDRLYDMNLWTSTGFSSIKYNYGTFRSRGVELQFDTTPVSTRDITWNIGFNFSWYETVPIKLPDNGEVKNRVGGSYIYDPYSGEVVKVGGLAEGERFGTRYAWHYLGVYQTEEEAANAPYDQASSGRVKHAGDAIFEDRNGDGVLNNLDMVFMGYIRPNIQGGVTSSFSWKGLSARLVMDYAVGHVICNAFRGMMLASFRNNCNTTYEALNDTWQYAGDGSTLPKFTVQSDADYAYNNYIRTGYNIGVGTPANINVSNMFKKGDYLAFREFSLLYNLPGRWLSGTFVKGVQIGAGVYNIGYITGYDGMTPEIFTGKDYGVYPRPREWSLSLNLNF